ncbi:hypothetical protein [Lacunimicrobium album]
MITSEQLAEKMQFEILNDMQTGIVPPSVGNFSELHDYVDANCYGGSEALLDELDVSSTTDEEHIHALNTLCDLMNPAIELVNEWLANGGPFWEISQMKVRLQSASADGTVIPSITDTVANAANMAAIDLLVVTRKYRHIVAWGKWLGITPQTVLKTIELAEKEDAPEDSIQKIDGRWLRVVDIVNQTNRNRVDELAREPIV